MSGLLSSCVGARGIAGSKWYGGAVELYSVVDEIVVVIYLFKIEGEGFLESVGITDGCVCCCEVSVGVFISVGWVIRVGVSAG